jgi:MFS family permease
MTIVGIFWIVCAVVALIAGFFICRYVLRAIRGEASLPSMEDIGGRITLFLCGAAVLVVSYVLFRHVIIDAYGSGMGDFTEILFYLSLIVVYFAAVFKKRIVVIFVPLGYAVGFAIGLVFTWQSYRLMPDDNYHLRDDSWFVWTVIVLIFIAAGIILEVVKKCTNTTKTQ